jgi:hypothetical protein
VVCTNSHSCRLQARCLAPTWYQYTHTLGLLGSTHPNSHGCTGRCKGVNLFLFYAVIHSSVTSCGHQSVNQSINHQSNIIVSSTPSKQTTPHSNYILQAPPAMNTARSRQSTSLLCVFESFECATLFCHGPGSSGHELHTCSLKVVPPTIYPNPKQAQTSGSHTLYKPNIGPQLFHPQLAARRPHHEQHAHSWFEVSVTSPWTLSNSRTPTELPSCSVGVNWPWNAQRPWRCDTLHLLESVETSHSSST